LMKPEQIAREIITSEDEAAWLDSLPTLGD
jgi:hypothetical protein